MSIDEEKRAQIVDALELGMPMPIVADYVQLERSVIQVEMNDDPAFEKRVNKAVANCMYKRLKALDGLKNWQALAFILTSLWPRRFGRNSKGVAKLAKLLKEKAKDFNRLDKYETRWFDYLMEKLDGHNPQRPSEPERAIPEEQPRTTAD